MELRTLQSIRTRHMRSETRISYKHSRTNRRFEYSPSEEMLNNLINRCDSQSMISKQIKQEIKKKDQEMVSEVKKLVCKIKPKVKYYDENYIANAVKLFRNEKQAFIYKTGRYISGSSGRGRFIL